MKGKTILITGASRRLGLYLTDKLCQSNTIIVLTRDSSHELTHLSDIHPVDIYKVDYSDHESIMGAINSISIKYANIDLIINNASYFSEDKEDFYLEYQKYFDVHMLLPYSLITGLETLLTNSFDPVVIQISDVMCKKGIIDKVMYSSTKLGLENLTKSFAKKYGSDIRFMTLLLGPIKFSNDHSESDIERIQSETLVPCVDGFAYVNETISYVASCNFLTGSSIDVDGGRGCN